jgi:glycosyltransferase involved in cell wall biosynthesis
MFLTKALMLLSKILFINRIKTRKKNSVLYLDVYPQTFSSGYKWRVESWVEILKERLFKVKVFTFVKDHTSFFDIIENKKKIPFFLVYSMWKRFFQILHSFRFETVIVRRELLLFNDYGNHFMEKFLLLIHPDAILDFDDDISASKSEPREISKFGKLLFEHPAKFTKSLQLYNRFIVGSEYLKEKILSVNPSINKKNICVIPTCVNYDKYEPKKYDLTLNKVELVFGWLGGNQNLLYLDMVVDVLNTISLKKKIKLIVVAGKNYVNNKAFFEIENLKWSLEKEKEYIKLFDIGIMPLHDTLIGRGKCGFKLIQYMGMGVVSVATNITINGQIIEEDINGFLVKADNSNWEEVLNNVLERVNDFEIIGTNARATIAEKYTFEANKEKYIDFINRGLLI